MCRDLGTVADVLISELELSLDGVEDDHRGNAANNGGNGGLRRNTVERAHGLDASVVNSDGAAADGESNTAGKCRFSLRLKTRFYADKTVAGFCTLDCCARALNRAHKSVCLNTTASFIPC